MPAKEAMVDVADAELLSVKNKALSVHAMNVSLSLPPRCLFTRKGEKEKWMREQKERGRGKKEREGEKKR